jgi:hypothetical protein
MTGENRAHHGSQRQRDLVSQGAQCPCGPWSARPHQPAHHQPEIESRDLQEHALGDVVAPSQVEPAHSSGVVAVGETALDELGALSHQSLAPTTSDAPTIGVGGVALAVLATPTSATSIGLGYVRADPQVCAVHQDVGAVVSLVRHHFCEHRIRQFRRRVGRFVDVRDDVDRLLQARSMCSAATCMWNSMDSGSGCTCTTLTSEPSSLP